ncbi:MAG: hypothetical protein AB1486_14610 [Planctomycetota bacterium]
MKALWRAAMGTVLSVVPAFAGDSAQTTWNQTNTDGSVESGWVVSFPTGDSDFFNSRHDGLIGRPIQGVSVASADFGSGLSYPVAGLFDANFTLDPTGNTPDLSAGIGVPVPGGGAIYNWVYGSLGVTYFPASEPQHVVCQLPPGDSATLAIGNDDETTTLFSGWTMDGFTTPANGGYNFGMNANIDVSQELVGSDGVLGLYRDLTDETGDFLATTVGFQDVLGFVFFAPHAGSGWMMFLSSFGAPEQKVSGVLTTLPDGSSAYRRLALGWLPGLGGLTLNLVAVSGVPGVPGSVGVSNEVTIVTVAEPQYKWGVWDDCSFETGWVVSIPVGPSDYFNVNFNNPLAPKPNEITGIAIAVLDFGTTATAFPVSGAFPANYTVDPSGNTPDLANPYDAAPFPLPPVAYTSTCGLPWREFGTPIPYSSVLSDDVHGVMQFPPGDAGLVGVGGDTTPPISGKTGWTIDGYRTPANMTDSVNIGIRLSSR